MEIKITQFGILSVICLLVSNCAVREANLKLMDNQRPATAVERAAIVAYVKSKYVDPYSIRDARISSAVEPMSVDGSKTPTICINENAKNLMGAYTGISATAFYFNNSGQILRAVSANSDVFVEMFCKNDRLQYAPFSEIEQKS